MRNTIIIDSTNVCTCEAVVCCDTQSNEIILEIKIPNVQSPQFELYIDDTLVKKIDLTSLATNIFILSEEYWNLGSYVKFRFVTANSTGTMFRINFPETITDISVARSGTTEFTVISKEIEEDEEDDESSEGGGTSDGGSTSSIDVIDNLTSTNTKAALSANQGRILKSNIDSQADRVTELLTNLNATNIQLGMALDDIEYLEDCSRNFTNKFVYVNDDIGDLFELTDELDKRTDANDTKIAELQSKVGEGLSVEVGTVTTAEAGTEASVTNSGTDAHAVLDFVIPKGDAGENGVSVSSVAQTTTSTADGGTNVVTVTLSDGTKSTFNVKNGSKGSTGNGIKSTTVTYQASTSGTTVPTGTWSTSIPTVSAGSYLWTRVIFTYTDGTTATAYGVAKHGADGKDGSDANVSFTQALTSGTKIGTLTLDGVDIELYAPNDVKANQVNTTTSADYRVLLSTNAHDSNETNAIRKSTNFRANPATGAFFAKGFNRNVITGQTLDVNTLTLSAGSPEIMRYICKTSGGSSNITNIPVTGQPFILDVELIRWASTTDYITKQTFVSIGDKHREYVRYCTSGTWETNWTKRLFTDNNTTYGVASTSANGLMASTDKSKLDETNIAYGTCSTAGDASAKEVTIDGNSNWALKKGAIVTVKFTNTNTASNHTLNVNGTGAKQIWYNNAVYTGNSSTTGGYANRYVTYVYDGTYWVWIGHSLDANTTYTNASLGQGYGTCATAEATTAKVVTLSSYALTVGGVVAVKFTYAVPASATMNINSKGAKAIYHRGSAIKAGVIKAGDIATFIYDGTQYHLLAIDRTTTGTLTTSDVVDNLTSTSTTAPLSAKQGKVINDKVNELGEHGYSLAINYKVTSTTASTQTTYSSRKFSDYDYLVFTVGNTATDVRNSITLPLLPFKQGGIDVLLDFWIGPETVSAKVYNQICVEYVSDTQYKVYAKQTVSADIILNIYGFKMVDKSTV